MISVEQAVEKILSNTGVLEEEERPILDAMGQVLAEDIYSTIDIPPLDNSAMDGFAVRSEDTRGASQQSPRLLKVIDTVMAGSISKHEVKPGTAVRIMTGAPLPAGADAVVKFEDSDEAEREKSSAETGILCPIEPDKNVRRAGEDVTSGSQVLRRGVVIRPPEVGVLASLGRSKVKVVRRPTVAILATGSELVDINRPLTAGKIYNSNTYSIAALVRHYGGIPRILDVAWDSEDALLAGLRQGLDADLIITTGGVSMGDYDVVKDVLAKQGEVIFWKVRMKPGKPVTFSRIGGGGTGGDARSTLHLGLPGNPVSAMITFELFARPAILKMMGRRNLDRLMVEAVVTDSIRNEDGRRVFARAIVEKRGGQYVARLTGPQGSGILTSMSLANGLVIVPEHKPMVEKGDLVQVMILDWKEESCRIDI